MAPSIRVAVRRHLSARIQSLRSLHVSWFGGEPLLGYDVIEELAPDFQEQAAKHNTIFESAITTNGICFRPKGRII
jgi:uncharacterized protein